MWVWGNNGNAQLGVNDGGAALYRRTPVTTLTGGTNWKQAATGMCIYHTSAIKTDGTLWTWGLNGSGQLGINTANNNICTPVTTFAGGINWKQVTGGLQFTAAIKTDGTLWTWGLNEFGQLGVNNINMRCTPVTTFAGGANWKQVVCGFQHTAAIKTDGTLWTWGRNAYGQLGVNDAGATFNRTTPVTTFAGGTNWKQVSCGAFHTSAIKTDGTLWVWGRNDYVSLGDNTTTQRNIPVTTFAGGTNWKQVSCGGYHMSAIKTDGTLWTWGYNGKGELGVNDAGATLNRTTPVTTFVGGTNWKNVTSGYNTSAVKTDGTLWTWGLNSYGQLGVNDTNIRCTPVTTFAGGTNWKRVEGGYYNIYATTYIDSYQ